MFYSNRVCLNWVNELSERHNKLLVEKLHALRNLHPHATIIDLRRILQSFHEYLPIPAPNLDSTILLLHAAEANALSDCSICCGNEGSKVCPEPSRYISWDGMHLTEAANKVVAEGVILFLPSLTRAHTLHSSA
ncbi:GDSL esterase/lipase At2g27360-like [Ananas comosus]|uniref:GDSL esterase/lipase At2g27360-like n=1 Tax=Ananas comosus TaxID=4615 RepID=A0A6P5FY53_ANACO|nr:GDSL esterase/lipase At2g27360-like [Ananas comosus]